MLGQDVSQTESNRKWFASLGMPHSLGTCCIYKPNRMSVSGQLCKAYAGPLIALATSL